MSKLKKFLYLQGTQRRNPSLWSHYEDLLSTDHAPIENLKKLQEERLQQLVLFALKYSPFYQKLWKDFKSDLEHNWSLTLFHQLPIVDKKHLLQFNESIHTPSHLFKRTFFCETSGTSGQVLTFHRNESWDSFNRASMFRGYSWYGVRPWDFNIYFWGYNTDQKRKLKIRLMDWLVNRYRLFEYDEQALLKLKKLLPKAKYIEGYSSMIYELAKKMEGYDLDSSNLRMIKGTSEKIYDHYHLASQKSFGRKIVSEYGAAETGIIAFECPEGNMHLNLEGVYVEQDQNGEIIVSNLHSYSFPIVRYRLGDVVEFSEEKCTCGRAHPVLKEVTGRIGKNIYGLEKQYPSLTLYYIFKNLFFNKGLQLNYQAHQNEKGYLEIWIKEALNANEKKLILEECQKYFQSDLQITLLKRNNFREEKGKLRDFLSSIN